MNYSRVNYFNEELNEMDKHENGQWPSPFFFCLASSNRPRFSRFQKKKKKESYAEGNESNYTLFQTIVTLI